MKIDELIEELEAVKEEHGNLKVWTGEYGIVYKKPKDEGYTHHIIQL